MWTSPGRAAASRSGSRITLRIAASSDNMVMTTSASKASDGAPSMVTPSTEPPERFHATTSCPAAARFRAIARPMAPRPIKPIRICLTPPAKWVSRSSSCPAGPIPAATPHLNSARRSGHGRCRIRRDRGDAAIPRQPRSGERGNGGDLAAAKADVSAVTATIGRQAGAGGRWRPGGAGACSTLPSARPTSRSASFHSMPPISCQRRLARLPYGAHVAAGAPEPVHGDGAGCRLISMDISTGRFPDIEWLRESSRTLGRPCVPTTGMCRRVCAVMCPAAELRELRPRRRQRANPPACFEKWCRGRNPTGQLSSR